MTELTEIVRSRLAQSELATRRFVIFGRGRSGSTALVSLLNQPAQGVVCEGEMIRDYKYYPLQRVLTRCSSADSYAWGCKILSYQVQHVWPKKQRAALLRQLESAGFRILYLRRTDLLLHAISNIRARELGFHERKSSPSRPHPPIHVDTKDVEQWIRKTESLATYEMKLLQGLHYLELTYEQHLLDERHHQKTVDEICDYLDIDRFEASTGFRKVSPLTLEESVTNALELISYFETTPYSIYLEPHR